MSQSRSLTDTLWTSRSPRERVLLAVMAALIAVVVAVYGVLLPLQRMSAAAEARHALAAQRLAEVTVAETAAPSGPAPASGDLQAIVIASATQAGISLSNQRLDNADQMTIGVASIDANVLFGWLQSVSQSGVAVTNFSATSVGGGQVQADAVLERRGG